MEKRQSLSAAQRSAVSRGHRCHPEASPYRWVPTQRQAPRGSRPPAGCHRCRTPHCHLREQHREPSGTPRDHAALCACASPSATPCHITPGRLICQQVLVVGELGVVPPPPRAPNAVGHRVLRERGLGQAPGTVGHLEGGGTHGHHRQATSPGLRCWQGRGCIAGRWSHHGRRGWEEGAGGGGDELISRPPPPPTHRIPVHNLVHAATRGLACTATKHHASTPCSCNAPVCTRKRAPAPCRLPPWVPPAPTAVPAVPGGGG